MDEGRRKIRDYLDARKTRRKKTRQGKKAGALMDECAKLAGGQEEKSFGEQTFHNDIGENSYRRQKRGARQNRGKFSDTT